MPELDAIVPERRTGSEPFVDGQRELGFTLLEFWQWANSDLLSNRERGIMAEFLVARALGAHSDARVEWDAKDVVTADGIAVEVKCSAYVQSWKQADYSQISFGIGERRGWDAATNTYAQSASRCADVYVFCLLAEKDATRINPLDLSQWQFYVVARCVLDERFGKQQRLTLKGLETLTSPVTYGAIADAVSNAAQATRPGAPPALPPPASPKI